ncbi:hypothetical protein ACGGZK_03355 [Agromyces sp. MMS24-K17]|uniref:hypothetical protein n=1 Tax=Agromyces sp. MMS24-K17 TaxID=3372850 RepID=UPI00375475CB
MTAVSAVRWIVRDTRFPDSDPRAIVGVVDHDGGGFRVAWMRHGARLRCRTLIEVLAAASSVLDTRMPEE